MDPIDKKKAPFDTESIIQLKWKGETVRMFYNQISAANLAKAFQLATPEGLFLRRPDYDLVMFPNDNGSFNVPMDGALYEVQQRIMFAPEEVVLDSSVPPIDSFNLPNPKIMLFNTNNSNTSKPDQASQPNITLATMNVDNINDSNNNMADINNNTNQLLDPTPEEKVPEQKEKPQKLKATANNIEKIAEMMQVEPEVAINTSVEQKDDVVMDNNINVTTPPRIKLVFHVETPNANNNSNTNTTPNTNKTPKQKKRKIIEEEDDEDFTPGGKKKSAKKKRVTYNSDDDEDYTPSKKEAKKKETKKRGRQDDDDEDDEDRTPNKRMKLNDGSPKKKNMTPRYFFASAENNNVAVSRENGALIANDIKSWVTALEALPEKDMTPALIPEENTEAKVESSSADAATPILPESKSPKLRKSPSQTKIEKPNHKVDVEKFYECLRPTDWTQQAPEKPIGLKSSLLAYQRRAVAWMIAQERRTRPRLPEERVELDKCTWGPEVVLGGKGILADEMGLGKTIELIALILLNDPLTNDGILPVRPDDEMRRVKNTLIVAPNILVNQWCSELQKHAPGLVVTVYDGMQNDPEVTKDRIATSHVVVTSYEVLRSEIHYIDDFHMSLRRSSQVYEKPKTPLVNFVWWRVCIDEAQEVKTSTNQAAAMVSKIPAIHRWAVTGTPVKSSFEDIRGLLIFLGLHEYWDRPTKELLPLLGTIMWRHAKAHVQDDIAIPGTTMHRHTLNLSKFEKFCLEIVVKKQKSIGEDTQNAQNELAKFFSAPFAVVYDLMELKKTKVTDKNKATCLRIMLEESIKETRQKQAQLCDIMNEIGDASFAMFEKDPKRLNMLDLARDSYQSILDLIFENKDSDLFMKVGRIDIGDDSVNVPALLTTCPGATFHALVNLSRVTASRDANKDPQNDDHLERAQMVQLQHLGPIKSDVSKVAEKYKKHRREINAISNNRKNNYRSPWWVRILKFIKNGKSPHFTEKSLIKSLNSGVIQSYNTIFTQDRSDELKLSVTSIDELIERITVGLKEMDEARTNAIKALKGELPVSMKELEAFEKAIDHADDMFTKYEASVATPDNTTATNTLDKKDALIQTRKSAKLNETERILLFLEKIVINDSNYYFHLIVPKEFSKSSVNPTSTNVRDREVLSILTEDKQVNMSIVLNDEKTEVDKQSLINDMKFVKNIQTVEVKDDNNAQKIDFENLDPFQEFHQDSAFKPRMEIDDMPGLENVAEDANNNNNNNNQQQAQAEEEEPVDLTSETFLHYKYYDSYNKKTEASIHYLSLCYHEASAQFKEFEYIKLEVRAGFDLIEALTKYAEALKEFESKAERKTFTDSTKEEINALIQTSINRRAEATTACKKQLEDIAFLLNERKLLQEARPEEAYGSKLARVIDLLEEQLNEDKECKALVFSSWSEPLVQLADLLKTKSIQHTAGQALQGMSAKKTHADRINAFKDNAAIRVMLLSALKQSTGLTLTQANHVVLMDHIEKSSEDQAIGRAYRIGQTKSTHVYKYAVNLSDVKDDELKERIKKINKDKVFIRSNVIDPTESNNSNELRKSWKSNSSNNNNNV